MEQKLIDRINELTNKAKTEGLTEDEKKEQEKLREAYIKNFRARFKKHLTNIKVVDEKGNDVTPDKLKREKAEQKQRKKTPIQ